MLHLLDHAAHVGGVLELDRSVHLVETQADQRLALIGGAPDRRSGLRYLDVGHLTLTPSLLRLRPEPRPRPDRPDVPSGRRSSCRDAAPPPWGWTDHQAPRKTGRAPVREGVGQAG